MRTSDESGADERTVTVRAGNAALDGTLATPADAYGLVVFAHGSGSSRHSPRNRYVAGRLNERGLATLLLDLLTPEEDLEDRQTRAHRFDVSLLAGRLGCAVTAAASQPATQKLPIGLFGASTGAAAALVAAAQRPDDVRTVVSRGGRPDLAGEALQDVRSATLLIVGARDVAVVDMNRRAMERLRCEKRLKIVPDATHLFEEPGALEAVADLAADWFARRLR
jgi:dienelactone hydrolase